MLARSDRFVIYVPRSDETLRSVAARFLGNEDRYWVIGDFNGITRAEAGRAAGGAAARRINPIGVYADSYQTVPILCYHRFGTRVAARWWCRQPTSRPSSTGWRATTTT